jgi:hypothetical protein
MAITIVSHLVFLDFDLALEACSLHSEPMLFHFLPVFSMPHGNQAQRRICSGLSVLASQMCDLGSHGLSVEVIFYSPRKSYHRANRNKLWSNKLTG